MSLMSLKFMARFLLLLAFCSLVHVATSYYANRFDEISTEVDSAETSEQLITRGQASSSAYENLGFSHPETSTNGKKKSKISPLQFLMMCFGNPTKAQQRSKLNKSWTIDDPETSRIAREYATELLKLKSVLKQSLTQQKDLSVAAFSPGRSGEKKNMPLIIFNAYHEMILLLIHLKVDRYYYTKFNHLIAPEETNGLNGEIEYNFLPNDVVDSIAQKAWKPAGDSAVKKLNERMIKNYTELKEAFSRHPEMVLQWWNYIFKSWEHLLKIQFLSRDTIETFFVHPQILKQLYPYTNMFLRENSKINFFSSASLRLTDHWYWNLSHGPLNVLSKKAEDTINSNFLLFHRYEKKISALLNGDNSLYNRIYLKSIQVGRFSVDYYPKQESRIVLPYVDRMIHLVASTDAEILIPRQNSRKRAIVVFFCDVLQHIEQHLPPDIINPRLQLYSDSERFDRRFKLIETSAQLNSLYRRAEQFYEYIRVKDPNDWNTSSIYESVFKDHLNQFSDLFIQYQNEIQRVIYEETHHGQTFSNFNPAIAQAIDYFEKVRTQLEEKSTTFSAYEN